MTNPNLGIEHPVGTGVGAAAGGIAAGALAGTMAAGPVGTVVGAAVGAVAGGLAGKGIAEAIDPTVEETYWRKTFSSRPYVKGGTTLTTTARPIVTVSIPTAAPKAVRSSRQSRI